MHHPYLLGSLIAYAVVVTALLILWHTISKRNKQEPKLLLVSYPDNSRVLGGRFDLEPVTDATGYSEDSNEQCLIPPAGWLCTRKPVPHDGPCAAIPDPSEGLNGRMPTRL